MDPTKKQTCVNSGAREVLIYICVTFTVIRRQEVGYKGVRGYRVICMIQDKVPYYC